MRRDGLERRNLDRFVSAFLPEHVQEHGRRWSAVCVPIEVHRVVEIAGSRPFTECAQFFSECFLIGIAISPYPSFWLVSVWMKYLAAHGGKNQFFICRQIELDLGPAARGR